MPQLSIILPVFNGSVFLGEAIQSVLHQTYKDFELLIIDDGSTDKTKTIVDQFCKTDSRIAYYYKEHSGLSASLNYGLLKSKGDLIARIDADDRWLPDKLMIQNKLLRENPSVSLIGSSVSFINPNGVQIHSLIGFNHGMELKNIELKRRMLRNNVFCSSTLVFKKSLINSTGKFNENLETSMDYEFLIRALSGFEGLITRHALVEYRISKNMMTLKNRKRMIRESIRIRLQAMKLFSPPFFMRILVLKDILGLKAGRFLDTAGRRSHLSRYLD